jgi:hypothetical protein
MPLTSNCSFTSEQRSQFLLRAENRPSSELWDEFGLQARAPPRGSECPRGPPRAFPPQVRPELGGGETGGLSGNSGLAKIPAPLSVDLAARADQ